MLAIIDNHGYVLSPLTVAPVNEVDMVLLPQGLKDLKRVAPDGDLDWVIPNDLAETVTAQVAEEASDVRWQVEELPRGIKQLTGSEKCQGRAARAQRNHLACCYHAWVSLKVKAKELG